jgi:hypothetical protein
MATQLDAVQLPASLIWSDEHSAQAVAQAARRTLDGSLLVFYAGLAKGRSITLESRDDSGWLSKTQVDALRLLADSPGGVYTLTLRGNTYQVMFRHHEPPAFEASPLFPFTDPQAGDYYLARLRLMTV